MNSVFRKVLLLTIALASTACAPVPIPSSAQTTCQTSGYSVTGDFPGAHQGGCRLNADHQVEILVTPEIEGEINDSAWYAFRVIPKQPTVANITLRYEGGHHRYKPKLSADGQSWRTIPETDVKVGATRREATIRLELDDQPVWIAAQEILTPRTMSDWTQKLAASTAAEMGVLGVSSGNQPIHRLDVNRNSDDVILIVGRQHPPEVTGAIALQIFSETLLGDDETATDFLERYHLILIPMLNPDGVTNGYWRTALGGVDLNRDWGPFTQPETRLIKNLLDELVANGKKIRLFLDFHSTRKNLFYAQSNDEVTVPRRFAKNWELAARPHLENYPFILVQERNSGLPTSKNYMYTRFGIPSITYEVGDETPRGATEEAAQVFATEMMRLMNELKD